MQENNLCFALLQVSRANSAHNFIIALARVTLFESHWF